ncbi:MAG: hypothetical protein ACT4P7_07780 [Gemmatimonadaceae bacterium]
MPIPSPLDRLVRLACFAVLSGCGSERSDTAAADSPRPTVQAVDAGAPAVAADTGCRKEGAWSKCAVEDRLEHAGLVIEPAPEPATIEFLSVRGTRYTVGAGDDELQVFLYPNEAARRHDTDKLDSVNVSPRDARRSYRVMPLLVTSNNLAALVFTLNDRTRERMALALSAGLPQPRR